MLKTRTSAPDLVRFATTVSVVFTVLILLLKLVGCFITGSMAMLAVFIDSLLDLISSSVNFFAIRFALSPPDKKHSFGHYKIEFLAILGQSCFIGGSSIMLLVKSLQRTLHPTPLTHVDVGIFLMVLISALTIGMVIFQKVIIRKTKSSLVKVDCLHITSDLLIDISVIISLSLAQWLGWHFLDIVFAIGIAAYMFITSWKIGAEAVHVLLDREVEKPDRNAIEKLILKSDKRIENIDQLRTRAVGFKQFIQGNLLLTEDIPLSDLSLMIAKIQSNIHKHYPDAEMIFEPQYKAKNNP